MHGARIGNRGRALAFLPRLCQDRYIHAVAWFAHLGLARYASAHTVRLVHVALKAVTKRSNSAC